MKRLVIVCLCAALAVECAALDATLMLNGAVRFRLDRDYQIEPLSFLPGWRGANVKGGGEIKPPGVASFRFADGGREVMDATVAVEQLDGGKVRIAYVFTAKEDVSFFTLGCDMHFSTNDVDGLTWQAIAERLNVTERHAYYLNKKAQDELLNFMG